MRHPSKAVSVHTINTCRGAELEVPPGKEPPVYTSLPRQAPDLVCTFQKTKREPTSCPCHEWNPKCSVTQPAAHSLYKLHHPISKDCKSS